MTTPYDDTFTGADGDPIDSSKWTLTGAPDIQSNAAELYNTEQIQSRCILGTEFDVQIDFNLLMPPSTNSFGVDLLFWVDATHWALARAGYTGSAKNFRYHWQGGGSASFDTVVRTNDYGSLRLIRSGAYMSAYYVDGAGSFTLLGTHIISANNGLLIARIERWNSSPDVTCHFDNFLINTGYTGEGIFMYKTVAYAVLQPSWNLALPKIVAYAVAKRKKGGNTLYPLNG